MQAEGDARVTPDDTGQPQLRNRRGQLALAGQCESRLASVGVILAVPLALPGKAQARPLARVTTSVRRSAWCCNLWTSGSARC